MAINIRREAERLSQKSIKGMLIIKQVTNMEQNSYLILLVVIIIHAQRNGSHRGMQDQCGRACEIQVGEIFFHNCLLIETLLQVFDGFENVGLKPQVKPGPEDENVANARGDIIKSPEIFQ